MAIATTKKPIAKSRQAPAPMTPKQKTKAEPQPTPEPLDKPSNRVARNGENLLIANIIGSRIRQRRKEMDYSQETLAKLLGMSFQQVQKYEKGTNGVSAALLFRIAGLLKVPITYFFEGAEAITADPAISQDDINALTRRASLILHAFNGLEHEGMFKIALDTARALAIIDINQRDLPEYLRS